MIKARMIVTGATGAFGGNQDRTASRERIEDDPLAMAAIPEGVRNQTHRFDGANLRHCR